MKTKILSLIVGAFVATLSYADVLYWRINPVEGVDTADWKYVKLVGDNVVQDIVGYEDGIAPVGTAGTSRYETVLTSPPAESFYIEIYSDINATQKVGWSTSLVSYSDLSSFIQGSADFKQVNATSGYGFQAVPEPTSGLMLLVGMAMLGLRRRKVA